MGVLGAVATVGGAIIGSKSTSKATKAQANSAAAQLDLQREMFERQIKLTEPWRRAGMKGLANLSRLSSPTWAKHYAKQDPGYQFRLDEGTKALERSAAARGRLLSGETGKALQRYGQDYASNEFSNTWNRMAAMAGIGQAASTQAGNYAGNYANNASNIHGQLGNAQAASAVAQGNLWSNALNNGMQAYSLYKLGGLG